MAASLGERGGKINPAVGLAPESIPGRRTFAFSTRHWGEAARPQPSIPAPSIFHLLVRVKCGLGVRIIRFGGNYGHLACGRFRSDARFVAQARGLSVVLQKQNAGYGFMAGLNASSRVVLATPLIQQNSGLNPHLGSSSSFLRRMDYSSPRTFLPAGVIIE